MTTSNTVTKNDLKAILDEVLPLPPLCELIYSGSFSTGTATLSKSIANYAKLIVVFSDNDGCLYTDTVINNKASSLTTMFTALRVTGVDYKKCMIVSFSGASMTVTFHKQGAGTATPTDGTYMTINKIYGVKSLETEPIAEMGDYVIEQGATGDWTYRKWNSGVAECWGKHSWTVTAWNTWGNLYESNNTYVTYPTNLFIEEPLIDVQHNATAGQVGAASVEVWTGGTAARTPNINLVRGNTTSTNVTAHVNIFAKGLWK